MLEGGFTSLQDFTSLSLLCKSNVQFAVEMNKASSSSKFKIVMVSSDVM